MNNNDKKPKKRGRKPKTNIIVNENPVFKNNKFDDVIVCINNPCSFTYQSDTINDNNEEFLLSNECNIHHCKNCNKELSCLRLLGKHKSLVYFFPPVPITNVGLILVVF